MTEPRRIDAHHHLWDLSVRDQSWTAELPVLRRSFLWEDLAPELSDRGVDGTILVETINVAEETPEFLALAAETPQILGVIGWVDLTAPDVADEIARLQKLPGGDKLVGLRHQVQGEPDPEWLLRPDVLRGLAAVAEAGLVFDLLLLPAQLPAAIRVVDQVRGMRWVLAHAAKPPIASGEIEPWRSHLRTLAANPGVACKLSGLVTEAGEDWSAEQIAPFATAILEAFGPDRVMVGSDWPVCLLQTSYAEVDDLHARLLDGLSADEFAQARGGTAQRWYLGD